MYVYEPELSYRRQSLGSSGCAPVHPCPPYPLSCIPILILILIPYAYPLSLIPYPYPLLLSLIPTPYPLFLSLMLIPYPLSLIPFKSIFPHTSVYMIFLVFSPTMYHNDFVLSVSKDENKGKLPADKLSAMKFSCRVPINYRDF